MKSLKVKVVLITGAVEVVYLIPDESSYLTGSGLVIDGGVLAWEHYKCYFYKK